MFLGILDTILFKFSNNLFHFVLQICSIQIVNITSFVIISNDGIKRIDCTLGLANQILNRRMALILGGLTGRNLFFFFTLYLCVHPPF